MDRLDKLKITINTAINIVRIDPKAVVIEAFAHQHSIAADSIIVAGNAVADTALADDLAAAGLTVQAIGDCTGLGLIAKATHSAAEAVNNIE